MQEDRPTISAQEAAALLGISKPTLLRLWAQGFVAGYRATPYRNGQIRLYRTRWRSLTANANVRRRIGYRLPDVCLAHRGCLPIRTCLPAVG